MYCKVLPGVGIGNNIVELVNASNVVQAYVRFQSDRVRANITGYATAIDSIGAPSTVAASEFWLRYVAGSGNAILEFYLNKSSTPGTRNYVGTITTATGAAVRNIRLLGTHATYPVVFDSVLVQTGSIGDNPAV